MKAMLFHEFGGSDVLSYEDVDQPKPGAGQVLIAVAGTSFNPVDAAIRGGYVTDFSVDLPHVPGVDVAGTVAALGAGVDGWRIGDAVLGFLPMTQDGAAAEYVLAPAAVLTAAPRAIELADAAALPAVGLTAWQALFEHANLTAGQRILINGAGGAVGGYALQLAKNAGAVVTATASARSADRLRARGADRIIDYTTTSVTEAAEGRFDVVLNTVRTSATETAELVGLVRDGGILVSVTGAAEPDIARSVRTAQVFVRSDAGQLAELVSRVDDGELRVDVADRRPLTELAAVHESAGAGTLPGKVVLRPE